MILTCHLLVGAAIASKISNPILALPLAFLSHYFLDLIPHKDYSIAFIKQKRWGNSFFDFFKVFSDIILGFSLLYAFSDGNQLIFVAAFLALIPDGLTMLNIIFSQNRLLASHQRIHMAANSVGDAGANKKIPTLLGITGQITVAAIAIFFLR